MNLNWIPYVVAMRGPMLELLGDLFKLTQGDVAASKAAIRRIRDRGYVLKDAEDEVDARIQAVRDRQNES